MINKTEIYNAAAFGINWLKEQKPATVKDISRTIHALSYWNETTSDLIEVLLSKKTDGFWETDKTLLDTSRACSALAGCGIIFSETIKWIEDQQGGSNWNNNEIDTAYALIALGDSGIRNEQGCEWLYSNYGKKWEHAGTTALIISALFKHNKELYRDFIKDRVIWILSKRESGGWTHIATSNLVIQALILTGGKKIHEDIKPSIEWLLGKQEKDNWGSITATSLSLISIKMYLDKLNND